ncbi:MAG: 4-vinyl reductase [Anaerolineales bacterium]|nr:4-vinyl reductase [Anaerolineales bacterium]
MEPVEKSGYFYANKFALIMLDALEDVLGKNGLKAILNLAHLPELIDNFPPDNLKKGFDFGGVSAVNQALEEIYGPRGGRGLALRAGRATFADSLRNFGALAGAGDLAFKVLPLKTKMRIGVPSMARIFSQVSDQQSTSKELDDTFVYTIHRCPVCWGRHDLDKPVCFIAVGLLQEGLKWLSGGKEFRVNESRCVSMGDEVCEFIIEKTPIR